MGNQKSTCGNNEGINCDAVGSYRKIMYDGGGDAKVHYLPITGHRPEWFHSAYTTVTTSIRYFHMHRHCIILSTLSAEI